MWFTYLDVFSFGVAIGGLGIMLVFWALNKYYKKRNNKHMENKYTKEYFSQFNVGDTVYFYNAQQGLCEKAEVISKSSVGYNLNGEHPRKNIKTLHQLVYASIEDLKEHQLRIIKHIEQSRSE